MIPELFAIGTGIASFLEKESEYDRKVKMKEDYTKSLEKLLIDTNETTRRIDRVSDTFNPMIMHDLNQTAIGNTVSGVLNPTTYSQLIPKKAEAIAREHNFIDERNASVAEKISQVQLMDIPQPGFWDFLSGGLEGYGAGVRVENLISESSVSERMMKLREKLLLNDKPYQDPIPKRIEFNSKNRKTTSLFDSL